MSVPLTAQRLAAAYDCLRCFPPFHGWKLPPAESVRFRVAKREDVRGEYHYLGHHHIMISSRCVGHMDTLMRTMAHEMVHLAQRVDKTDSSGAQHNADFHRRARLVCKRFGWHPTEF